MGSKKQLSKQFRRSRGPGAQETYDGQLALLVCAPLELKTAHYALYTLGEHDLLSKAAVDPTLNGS